MPGGLTGNTKVLLAFIYFHFGVYANCSRVRGRVHSAKLDHNDNSGGGAEGFCHVRLVYKENQSNCLLFIPWRQGSRLHKKSKFSKEVPELYRCISSKSSYSAAL